MGPMVNNYFLDLEDPGIATCTVTNYSNAALPDLVGPSQQAFIQGILELECTGTGSPLPEITWFKNGLPLTSATDSIIALRIIDGVSILRINVTTAGSDGNYMCIATNVVGSVSSGIVMSIDVGK